MNDCELRITHVATLECATPFRHALSAFLSALDINSVLCSDVITAAGEAMANALEHAYKGHEPGDVELYAKEDDKQLLLVAVRDHGTFIVRAENPGRGYGLPIAQAIAQSVSIDTDDGTNVQMTFDIRERKVSHSGAESRNVHCAQREPQAELQITHHPSDLRNPSQLIPTPA
jgi:anti-sigma regulatory factor (Ser/Thr protein kinase)